MTQSVTAFRDALLPHFERFQRTLATEKGDWVVKGFIDIYRNIYTISVDTKVVSKIIELLLFPVISQFASEHGYKMVLAKHQNYYPDISFIAPDGSKFAVDFKSTYRTSSNRVNGFTLGAFSGYFRKRNSTKNITFPYAEYSAHFVLGVIYSRSDEAIDERRTYRIEELYDIMSVIDDFDFLLQEKWQIASDKPGSGNTKNIGSVKDIEQLLSGSGPFTPYGEKVFDDYWMNYLTKNMAQTIDMESAPYANLEEYWIWRERAPYRKTT